MLTDHCRANVACDPAKKPPSLEGGIDETQWEEIDLILSKKVHKNIDDISRWNMIWRVLFPGAKEPPNPCECKKIDHLFEALMNCRE